MTKSFFLVSLFDSSLTSHFNSIACVLEVELFKVFELLELVDEELDDEELELEDELDELPHHD
jgi:hypothetical protein